MNCTYNEILDKMVQAYFDKSGQKLNENSFEYKVIEAAASEFYSLSCYGDFILKQAFVQSAGGEYLDRHGYMRMCERKAGRKASGVLTFSVSEAQDDDIVIEERSHEEVTHINGKPICAEGVNIINPGFDVTPHELIAGIITEKGILRPDYNKSIAEAFKK